jgi:hypothetical protein
MKNKSVNKNLKVATCPKFSQVLFLAKAATNFIISIIVLFKNRCVMIFSSDPFKPDSLGPPFIHFSLIAQTWKY